jgi:hypothetical protein
MRFEVVLTNDATRRQRKIVIDSDHDATTVVERMALERAQDGERIYGYPIRVATASERAEAESRFVAAARPAARR